MKKAILLLSLILAVVFTGVCNASQNDLAIFYIPASLSQAYGFPVKMWNDKVVMASTKEVMVGYHTTCIGASFVDKEPKPEPIRVVQTPPPLPPVVPKPLIVAPVEPKPLVVVAPKPPVAPVIPKVEKPKPEFDPVHFDINKSNINPFGAKVLDKNGNTLKAHPEIKVEIGGHTDNTGSDAVNKVISEKRAKSVKHYLQDKFSIPDSQLTIKGYGSSKPLTDNSTIEGRIKNRRVEFRTIE